MDTRTFTHDGAGNVLTAANAAGAYTRTYDELDRLETQSGLWGVGYTFDYNDRERTGVTDTLGGDADWVRDDAGRVTRRTFTDGTDEMRIDLGYNARDERTSETRYADIGGTTLVGTTVRGYDDAGNLTGLHYKDAGAATISDYVNAFDAADRITSETRNGGAAVTFSYDTTSQLVADSAGSYSYDLAGNRTMAGYATGASNRITSDGTWAFSHDEGNVTKRSKGALAETWTYGYDHDNQMAWAEQRATDGGALLMRLDFTYDVFSQRVKETKTVGAATTERRYTFADRGEVEAELDATDALVTRYLRGEAQGELWGRVGAGGAEWLLQDRLGSLRDVADASGAGVDHIDYDGFGNVVFESAPALTGDFTFTGLWRQRETGLFHAFWRDYGPSWGGWMQDDPVHIEGGGDANIRRYVGNNPTNLTDPSGLAAPPTVGSESLPYLDDLHKERYTHWRSPITPSVTIDSNEYAVYMRWYERLQSKWIARVHDPKNKGKKWYEVQNPPLPWNEGGYPPGFLKPGLRARVLFGDAMEGDGFMWIPSTAKAPQGVSVAAIDEKTGGYHRIRDTLKQWKADRVKLDMLIVGGHAGGELKPSVNLYSGVADKTKKWQRFNHDMPRDIWGLIRDVLDTDGILVISSCGMGTGALDIQNFATELRRPVAAVFQSGCTREPLIRYNFYAGEGDPTIDALIKMGKLPFGYKMDYYATEDRGWGGYTTSEYLLRTPKPKKK